MAITHVDTTTFASAGINNTSVTNNTPAGIAAGDLMLWAFSSTVASGATPATPSGWSVWQATVSNGTTSRYTIFYKFATASEPASYTASGLTASRWTTLLSAFRGVDQTTPQDTAPTSNGNANQPAITTVTADAWVVSHGKALASTTPSTWASTTGTIQGQVAQNVGSNDTQGVATQSQSAPGSVTPNLTVGGTTSSGVRITSALRPAAGGTPATFTAVVGDAAADGGTATFVGDALFSGIVGDAPADGADATMTGAAAFNAVVGDASADGGVAFFSGAAGATFTTLVGDAPAAGGTSAFFGAGVFACLATDATAAGGTATFVGTAAGVFTASAGDATASGGTAAFAASGVFVAAAGTAAANGGVATFRASVHVLADAGRLLRVALEIRVLPVPAESRRFAVVAENRTLEA